MEYPASPGYIIHDKQKRLNSATWSTYSSLPLLQPRKEPLVFPVMRWIFILLALTLLGFVLFVFGHLVHDHVMRGHLVQDHVRDTLDREGGGNIKTM